MAQPPSRGGIGTADLADLLGVSIDFVRQKTRRDEWPHLRVGPKAVRFLPRHVEAIIASMERGPAAPTAPTEDYPDVESSPGA